MAQNAGAQLSWAAFEPGVQAICENKSTGTLIPLSPPLK